jgi:hypothetical protein
MEAQKNTNFNEFYRSTGEHLVNIRAPRMFWQGVLPRKFANFKVQNEECHYNGKIIVLFKDCNCRNEMNHVIVA